MEAENLESLEDLPLHLILGKLEPEDTARIGCVSMRFKLLASDDSLWSYYCYQDLALTSPIDSSYKSCPSFKEAYWSWRNAFSMYPWFLVLRVRKLRDRLKGWLKVNCPEIDDTLLKGASESEINEFETAMRVHLPLPTRVLYRFLDGQDLTNQTISSSNSSVTTAGLIGGYTVYDHNIDVFLCSLKQAAVLSARMNQHLGYTGSREYIVIASSYFSSHKLFFLDCSDGHLYVGTKNLISDGEMIPCAPNSLAPTPDQKDAMLLWLEEHCRRLENGIISFRKENNIRRICQYPENTPLCSTSLTNGVKIRASAVFVPELSDPFEDDDIYFSYSIRMSLLPEGCTVNGIYYNSCQLFQRHWLIRAEDCVVSDVNAEAVIGQYPLLLPGESEFVYQSATTLPSPSGSIEGSFTFVPGRLAYPEGSEFEAIVAPFPLELPEYIF